jgi:hypothetical protein
MDPGRPAIAERPGRGRHRAAARDHVVDEEHPRRHRPAGDVQGAPAALGPGSSRLRRPRSPPEQRTAGHAHPPGDGAGQETGLVEAAAPAPGRRGGGPGDHLDVDRAPVDRRGHAGGEEGDGGARVAVLQAGDQLPPHPGVGERRRARVDARRPGEGGRRSQLASALRTRRGTRGPADRARRGQQHAARLGRGCDVLSAPGTRVLRTTPVAAGGGPSPPATAQHRSYVPTVQDERYSAWAGVSESISTPMVSSLRRAISRSISTGTS